MGGVEWIIPSALEHLQKANEKRSLDLRTRKIFVATPNNLLFIIAIGSYY